MNRRADNREVRKEFEPARRHGVAARHANKIDHLVRRLENTMAALASKPTKASTIDSTITGCTMLTRDGQPCDKPGQIGLPTGICPEHAVAVFRAVSKLVAAKAEQEARA